MAKVSASERFTRFGLKIRSHLSQRRADDAPSKPLLEIQIDFCHYF